MKPHVLQSCLFAFIALFAYSATIEARDISALTAYTTLQEGNPRSTLLGGLGKGFSTERGRFVANECLQLPAKEPPLRDTGLTDTNFSTELKAEELSEALGVSADFSAQYGAVTASIAAKFKKSTEESAFSIGAVWKQSYIAGSVELGPPRPTTEAEKWKSNIDTWVDTCGDEYVSEVVKGSRLLVSIRITFKKMEEKESFELRGGLKGSMASVNLAIDKEKRHLVQNGAVHVIVLQYGGEHSKMDALFAGKGEVKTVGGKKETGSAQSYFVSCNLGDIKSCLSLIENITKYGPQNLTIKPAPLYYKTIPYPPAIGVDLSTYTPADGIARSQLIKQIRDMSTLLVLGNKLFSVVSEPLKGRIEAQILPLESNIRVLANAIDACFESPKKCDSIKANLEGDAGLQKYAAEIIKEPPKPSISIRLMTRSGGILSREESIKQMLDGKQSTTYPEQEKKLASFSKSENASVIVYIEGQGLTNAELFFVSEQSKSLKSISLIPIGPVDTRKFGKDFVVLVLLHPDISTAGSWWDLPITKLLVNNRYYRGYGQGELQLIVKDIFGRTEKLIIERRDWSKKVSKRVDMGTHVRVFHVLTGMWWNSKDGGKAPTVSDDQYMIGTH